MTAFARKLGGRAELEANERGGLTARLIFPAPAETQRFYAEAPQKLERNQASA